MKFIGEYERIGDYSINILQCAQRIHEEEITLSKNAWNELDQLEKCADKALTIAGDAFASEDAGLAAQVEPLEETVDEMLDALRERHIGRLKQGDCSIEGGVVFLDVLTERISEPLLQHRRQRPRPQARCRPRRRVQPPVWTPPARPTLRLWASRPPPRPEFSCLSLRPPAAGAFFCPALSLNSTRRISCDFAFFPREARAFAGVFLAPHPSLMV